MTQRVAIVTGGSRGIGAGIAVKLAADGFDVVISYARDADAAARVVADIAAQGRRGIAVQADSGRVEDNCALIARAVAEFGRLDVLVCNAGTYPYAGVEAMTVEQVSRTLDLNVRGVMLEAIEAARHMGTGGRMIFIGSAFAERVPFANISLYAATKAALAGFARGLARDLGPRGITVNVVNPGPIDTDLNPADGAGADLIRGFMALPHYGTTGDIADFVSYLASEKAGFITGTALTVDGGLTA
ncbi:SDR family NAD(P)-dependent oxidoreductase [Gluconacetobacter tumulisoli]|uniref:SDR family oxidoreductase n=1 Tax=Gluconacetobacter tumulisoli TaxID=1286189 RepID=A0A7W4K9C5_9PROT|nr:SDR family oxidoreductase [Gluconacetobacter tumulisoli]MBB2202682.1 SDR family oxidoreductase [Gluconacetobacter tumulisoli]